MKWKLPVLAILSGILLSMAWLGVSGLILLIAFVPLFYLNHYFVERKEQHLPIIFWSYAFISMLVWNVCATWWIGYATLAGAVFAIVANSFLMSIVWLLAHYACRLKHEGFGRLFFVFAWLSFEYLHFNWDLSWPWLTLGNGLSNDVRLIQWYEFTGVFGGSLWILLSNLLMWKLVKRYAVTFSRVTFIQLSPLLLLLIIPSFFSIVKFKVYSEPLNSLSVVVLQPNIDPYHDKFDRMSAWEQHRLLIDLAETYNGQEVDLFVGPETALHNIWQNEIDQQGVVVQLKTFLKENHPNAAFVIGATTYRRYYHPEEATPTSRFTHDSTMLYDAFNSALFITANQPCEIYHKSKLVSGVEKMPFKRYLKILERFVVNLGGATGSLATPNNPLVFKNNENVVGVPICYESVFGDYSRAFIQKGANLLTVITNDGWWHNSPGYRQHLAYSRVQAIQFRRSVVRSANTGISALINSKGQIVQETPWWVETTLKGEVNRNEHLTFYARYGDYIARVAVFMFVLMLLSVLVEKLKNL
ncbi:MAG TPA: apolipoprotein N-acyltransferase [Prolixibacteraceae bacterium]|nr:apolipoprotein N-acyltransferase [Prolixibacteraceae bacterium]